VVEGKESTNVKRDQGREQGEREEEEERFDAVRLLVRQR